MAEPTLHDRLGGDARLHAIAHRFYALIDSDPAYAELRAIHGADLAPVADSLARFLVGWSGGARDWFTAGRCIMGMHRPLPVTRALAGQWVNAMARTLATEPGLDRDAAEHLLFGLARVAHAMAHQEAAAA